LTVGCRAKESQEEATKDEAEGRAVVCLAVRRNLTRGSVYGCFHKHPKTDARFEAPQKATIAPVFFDTDDSLDPSATK